MMKSWQSPGPNPDRVDPKLVEVIRKLRDREESRRLEKELEEVWDEKNNRPY